MHCGAKQHMGLLGGCCVVFLIIFIYATFSAAFGSKNNQTPIPSVAVNKESQLSAAEQAAFDKTKAGQLCKKHADWSNDDCKLVADKQIWIGMSYDMLIAIRGKPNSANPSNYGSGTHWQWCWYNYTPSCFYGHDDGIIDSYN